MDYLDLRRGISGVEKTSARLHARYFAEIAEVGARVAGKSKRVPGGVTINDIFDDAATELNATARAKSPLFRPATALITCLRHEMRGSVRFSLALAAACALGAVQVAFAAPDKLEGDALEKAVAGKVVYMSTEGGTVPIHYNANKTMSGKLQMVTAVLAVTQPKRDNGTWWVDGERLCQRWSRWLDGKTHCYKLQRDGNNVLWERNDGRKGKARLGK